MYHLTDPSSPRNQLPVEKLPHGFVPWPQHLLDALETEQARKGFRFADGYVKEHLERATLAWFYDGLMVAYRPSQGGIEVLGVGDSEAYVYLKDQSVKVEQA